MQNTGRDPNKDIADVVDEFNSVTFMILKIAKKFEPNSSDLEWLRKKMSLVRSFDQQCIILRSKDKIWNYRDQIIKRDLNFFINNNFGKYIKNDDNRTFMYTLINLIKRRVKSFSPQELAELWNLANRLLGCVAKYKELTGDFTDE